jgi:hypothetical protein
MLLELLCFAVVEFTRNLVVVIASSRIKKE